MEGSRGSLFLPELGARCSLERFQQKSCLCAQLGLSGDSKGGSALDVNFLPHCTVRVGGEQENGQDLISKGNRNACHLKEEVSLGERKEPWTRSPEAWVPVQASLEPLSQSPCLLGTQVSICRRIGLYMVFFRIPSFIYSFTTSIHSASSVPGTVQTLGTGTQIKLVSTIRSSQFAKSKGWVIRPP